MGKDFHCVFFTTLGYTGPSGLWLCPLILPGRSQAPFSLAPHREVSSLTVRGHCHTLSMMQRRNMLPRSTDRGLAHPWKPFLTGHARGLEEELLFLVWLCVSRVPLHVPGYMCGSICLSLRSVITLNCFSILSIEAGCPNQTHSAAIWLSPGISSLPFLRLELQLDHHSNTLFMWVSESLNSVLTLAQQVF